MTKFCQPAFDRLPKVTNLRIAVHKLILFEKILEKLNHKILEKISVMVNIVVLDV